MMDHSRMERERRAEAEQAWRWMGRMTDVISDLLYTAMLLEERYPELSEELEKVAQTQAGIFRNFGALLLHRGLDAPLCRVLCGRGTTLCSLVRSKGASVETVLTELYGKVEGLARDASCLFTSPLWEEEDRADRLLSDQREQLRRLRRLFF